MNHLLGAGAALSLLVTACGLLAYDRLVVRPSRAIGIVDVAEVYRLKEAEVASLITGSGSDEEHQRAMAQADTFAHRLPMALEELPRDCQCLVILRSAVVGSSANARDLTPLLKSKLEVQ
jgi:hypothetical protein